MNPNWNQIVREHLVALRLPPEREIEIVEEIALHLEALYDDALAIGLPEAEAEARAVQSCDWRLLECELSRAEQPLATRALQPSLELIEQTGGIRMESFIQDLRFGVRMLAKNPGFTLIAVLTLALGIGANTAIFSVVRGVLLRPLPFPKPERLIGVRESKVGEGHGNPLAWRSFFAFRDQAQTLEAIAAYINWNPDIERDDGTVRVLGAAVSHGYFQVMGVRPLLGRDFTAEDNRPDAPPTVMLSYELWQQMYGGAADALGQTMRIDGKSYAIIGVMPSVSFNGQGVGGPLGWRSIWTPWQVNETKAQNNPGRALRVNARLKTGVTLAQARAELETLMVGLKRAYPATHGSEIGVYAAALKDYVIDTNSQRAMWVLFGAVLFVLLIACANVANLLLARAAEREKELAIRTALGADRLSIVRQLLTESLLLSALGAAAGWLLAWWLVAAAGKLLPDVWQRMGAVRLDAGVLGFTLCLAVLTGLLFGLAPALGATKVNLNETLKNGARAASGSRSRQRLRGALVVLEIALALVLLVGSGLLLKSFAKLRQVELGFNPEDVLTMSLRLPNSRYPESAQRVNFFQQTLANIKQLPGVQSAAICFSLLMTGNSAADPVIIEGRPPIPKGEEPVLRGGSVSADYFRTMGIAFRKGRTFTEQEVWQGAPTVIIVNEAFAQRFFPNEDPIGKRVKVGLGAMAWSTIVGVVANHIQPGVDNRVWEEMFYPYVNTTDPPLWGMNLVVKTTGDPAAIAQNVISEARKPDRFLPIANIKTMRELTGNALRTDRFNAWLLGAFALLALLLAILGIYGVISYSVLQRMRELGIRLALGAQARDVLTLILAQGLKLALLGVGLGLLAAFALTRWMESLLFGVRPTDPLTFGVIAVALLLVALLACWLPARRATRVDPLVALRCE
jgi:putative ABC transport system permease protein